MARTPKRPRPNKEKRTEPNFPRLSNFIGLGRWVQRLRAGFTLFAVVLSLLFITEAAGTAAAQPAADRSLTADAPTAPSTDAAATNAPSASNAAPVTVIDTSVTAPQKSPPIRAQVAAADVTSGPDLSGMTHEELEARVKNLTASLASANTESEYFREQWTELKLRDEALGVEALTVDESKLEDKLVQAVKELYQSEMKRREAVILVDKLLVSTDKMLQTAPNYDPKLRADYEVATRAAKEYLAGHSGSAVRLATGLTDVQIADTNPELNAVILNIGKTQGVKEGMPFLIFQDNGQVGTVKIVLARDLVSAAQVESLKPNTVLKIGDKAVVQQ